MSLFLGTRGVTGVCFSHNDGRYARGQPNRANPFQASSCVTSRIGKVRHVAEPEIERWESALRPP